MPAFTALNISVLLQRAIVNELHLKAPAALRKSKPGTHLFCVPGLLCIKRYFFVPSCRL